MQRPAGILAALIALFLLAVPAGALAGPPTHPRLPALDLTGGPSDPGSSHPAQPFNHACGTAVDSQGNVYVASAGNDVIDIFNPDHEYLTSIANANEPCALALDGDGRLYVSESALGNVVRYAPDAFPFIGIPSYGPPQTIDASGIAEGVSVDPTTARLFVAEAGRVVTYRQDGTRGENEAQQLVRPASGTYTLTFEGQTTGALQFDAPASGGVGPTASVQNALESLSSIGPGNVVVGPSPFGGYRIVFLGAFASTDVETVVASAGTVIPRIPGFDGFIGEGELTTPTGVAAYSSPTYQERFVLELIVADQSTDQVEIFSGAVRQDGFGGEVFGDLLHRRTLDGSNTPGGSFAFGPTGAHLAIDPGNPLVPDPVEPGRQICLGVDEQACTAGHFLVYDALHDVVAEFDASGAFLDQLSAAELEDAQPTGLAVDRSGKADDGTIYVTSGAGPGAKMIAFGPLPQPNRLPFPEVSRSLPTAGAVAVDSKGNVYVAAGALVHIYRPNGTEIKVGPEGKGFPIANPAKGLAVDSTGHVYMPVSLGGSQPQNQLVRYYTPAVYPPQDGTQFSGPVTVADGNSFETPSVSTTAISVNPANDHLFIVGGGIIELGSVAEGSPIVDDCFACGLASGLLRGIGVYGVNGNVYISANSKPIIIVNGAGTELVGQVTGKGSPKGAPLPANPTIAVDQANGHVLSFDNRRGVVEEYDGAGAFVAEFGEFSDNVQGYGIAVDNSGGSANGNVYVSFDDSINAFDLTAFGPLEYGGPPLAVTGIAAGIEGDSATLRGTVDPRGFDLTTCRFEYLTDAQYLGNGENFSVATTVSCSETAGEIGHGNGPVPVHADLSGLVPETRYRFRLVAGNKFGESQGAAGLFGPPIVTVKSPQPVLYNEATLRADVDPSGLPTTYYFEYGATESYGQSSAVAHLAAGDGAVPAETTLTGLPEGVEFHFRIVVENDAKVVVGGDQTFRTRSRPDGGTCPNAEYRTGFSAGLPDCRAYELVTPADTRAATPGATAPPTAGQAFNNWLVDPRGEGAGESVAYFINGTLPGFEGTGRNDGYRALRTTSEGPHPKAGWATALIGPTYAQVGIDGAGTQYGVASDQSYWLYEIAGASESVAETLPQGQYLRTPGGFEIIGRGSLGTDPSAQSHYVSARGDHLIFSSKSHLETQAAPPGTQSVYDRKAGSASAQVVSLKPDGTPFAAGQNATYLAGNEDGSATVFTVGETLYLHREGTTHVIAGSPATFAGISNDGARVFHAKTASGSTPGSIFVCDTTAGSCVGGTPAGLTKIADSSIFVNVSPNGSAVLFTSETTITGGEENENGEEAEAGEDNLYAWDGATTRFVGVLAPQDFVSFAGNGFVNLHRWAASVTAGVGIGRSDSPTRSTPDGGVFVFQSHARLTPYDNAGKSAIYRYEAAAEPGRRLICVSCDLLAASPGADAELLVHSGEAGVVEATTVVSNLTDDGGAVFFQSPDPLVPEDANTVHDVYEWKAAGALGGSKCAEPSGCLSLISSGQGEQPSYLYGMSADGRDVFFETPERLVGADVVGSHSLYDARVEGGIPDPPASAPCQGDACQGQGTPPPVLPNPASVGSSNGNLNVGRRPCPKGKRRVKGRCVKRHRKSRGHRKGANRTTKAKQGKRR